MGADLGSDDRPVEAAPPQPDPRVPPFHDPVFITAPLNNWDVCGLCWFSACFRPNSPVSASKCDQICPRLVGGQVRSDVGASPDSSYGVKRS